MKKIHLFFLLVVLLSTDLAAQKKNTAVNSRNGPGVTRPKLIVGMVVDQMRWDFLYRYSERYSKGGIKRLLRQGFSAENTFIPYIPTYTACGHASVYTGSVPAINGIIGNDWYDRDLKRNIYCAEDTSVKTVGSNTRAGLMSPKNMLSTSITDELKLATNFKSKVIGISLKDRGSILPAGHTADAAYWFDGQTGDWISSTYYMEQLPAWLQEYNRKKTVNTYLEKNWNTLYPIETYTQSTEDDKSYEGKSRGEEAAIFPHPYKLYAGKDFEKIKSMPYGNTMTLELAKLAIKEERLGESGVTDFLAVSCSATDYVGHQYGPNSIEIEDTYLRLDQDLAEFFDFLDAKYGKDNYLFFLSADHGAAQAPGLALEKRLPGGTFGDGNVIKILNKLFESRFGIKKAILTSTNSQIHFDHEAIEQAKADYDEIKRLTIAEFRKQPEVADAVDLSKLEQTTLVEPIKKALTNGYNAIRSGDIYVLLKPGYLAGSKTGTTHGSGYPYDHHIPCVFMGWNVKPGKTNKTYHMTDIAATLAAMLRIQMPSGCVGEPITELTHQYQ
ncbi:alkaline phosphatase PafA [Pedobacter faecalis]|uniref:alkaline phosphatase PafA n=1 Tax=Pedobacter faecalis TaxID=3041495 RepID=UPI00254A4331|nr:alkaline phosphatase PafA [Pedobacter sp. ELA7]